ncbi:MAG TPA: BatA domain-containing protein [Gemmataceae bacterium]|nr:BatA domain-containing protein [Gemmataceae bacterium]
MDLLFLNPAYMVAGAALISAPIIIHLINRMRYKRIRWAAMEFLLKSQKRNRRRLIIEQLILLGLRCLLVALAGFLVARYIGGLGGPQEKPVDHLVVLDDTLSMKDRFKDENTKEEMTSFDIGKKKVLEIAKEALKANSRQNLRLVTLSSLDEIKFNERLNNDTFHKLESKLNDINPSRLHVKPADGVRWAIEQKLTDANHQRVLHFVSDLRESDWSGPEANKLHGELDNFTRGGGKVLLFDVAYRFRSERQAVAIHQDNIGISDFQPETRFTAENLPVQFTLTVKNYSAADKKNVSLKVKVNGEERPEAPPFIDLPPGESKHLFQLLFNQSNYNVVSAAIQEKDESGIPDDNIRVTVIQVKQQVPILMIDGSEDQPNGARKDGYYLQKLFVDTAKGYQVVSKSREELDNLDLTSENFPCLYLLDVPDLSDKALKKVQDYLEQGGHVAIFLGDHVKPKFYNEKLYAKGAGIFPVPLEEKKPERISGEERFGRLFEGQYQIFFRDDQHPIFREVADPKVKEVFKFLMIDAAWPVQNRLHWNADPTKVHELVTLPNRSDVATYKDAVNAILGQLDQAAKDEKFAKFQVALERFRGTIRRGYDNGLYALANALDQFLSERGDPKNPEKAPDLKEFWDMPENETFRKQVADLRTTAMYGEPLVLTKQFGKGESVVFLTTAGKAWNDWAGGGMASPTYPVVMLNLQKYLTSATNESSRTLGTPLDIVRDAEGSQDRARITFRKAPGEEKLGAAPAAVGEDASEKELETVAGKEDENKQLHFAFAKTREPGVYFVDIKGKPRPGEVKEPQPYHEAFVYNVDTENEGNLKRAAKDMLEQGSSGQTNDQVALITPDMRLTDLLAPKRKDMSEAPWLYLVILIVLIIEQALAVHLSFHLKGNEAQLPAGLAGQGRTPVPTTEAA